MIFELEVFAGLDKSMGCTKRGLIAFISLIVFDIILYYSVFRYTWPVKIHSYISIIPCYLLICSALAVQINNTLTESIVYGMLVGLVVYGSVNSILLSIMPQWNLKVASIDIITGIINCIIASIFVYLIK